MPIPKSEGYIVPPDPSPTEYQLRFICVPDDGQWIATINAALYELVDPNNWDISTIDNQEADVEAAVQTARNVVLPFVFQDLDGCMSSFCEEVANCIDTSPEVATALANAILNNPTVFNAVSQAVNDAGYGAAGGTPSTVSPDANDNNLLPANYTCDNDHFFGMSMEMVNEIHKATEEVFQQIDSSGGNWLDLVNSILDNIPIFELIGLITEVVDWYADTVSTAYASAWSTVVQQELACDIFCRIKDDCALSYDDFYQVYLDASGITAPPNDTFDAWWQVIQSAALGNDKQVVAMVDLLGLLVMRFGGKFSKFALGIRSFPDAIALAQDAVDSDWSILCTDCAAQWCWSADLTQFFAYDFSSTTNNTAGVLNGSQWDASDAVGAGAGVVKGIFIQWDIGQNVSVESVRAIGNAIQGTGTGGTDYAARFQLRLGGTVVYDSGVGNSPPFGAFDETFTPSNAVTINNIRFLQQIDNRGSQPTDGSGSLTTIELRGSGSNPFGTDNC